MSARSLAAPALAALLAASCGGMGSSASSTTTSSGTTGATTSGTGGAAPSRGDCATDSDCPGSSCVEVTPGGYRVCREPVSPVTSCHPGEMGCCNSDKCNPGEQCYPPYGYCGGLVGPQNRCLGDECQSDSECDGGVCAAAGVLALPVNTCVVAHCRAHSDCTAHPEGACVPIENPCCSGVYTLHCVYPGGCTRDSDCPEGYCVGDPATGAASCTPTKPACPI